MKLDAMKRQGSRTDLTLCQSGTKSRTDQLLGEQVGESARSVQRYFRLTELIPEHLDLIDWSIIQLISECCNLFWFDKSCVADIFVNPSLYFLIDVGDIDSNRKLKLLVIYQI